MASGGSSLLSSRAWSSHLSNMDGRDRALRTLQYACKFLRAMPNASLAAKASQVETTLSLSRQTFRLGKWVNVIAKQHKMTHDEGPVVEVLTALSDFGLFCYLLIDNLAFLMKVGALKGNLKNMAKRAAKFWVLNASASFLLTCIRIWRTKIPSKGNPEDRARARKKLSTLVMTATRYLSDDVVAYSLSLQNPLSPGLIGVLGLISSLIQSYMLWPRTVLGG